MLERTCHVTACGEQERPAAGAGHDRPGAQGIWRPGDVTLLGEPIGPFECPQLDECFDRVREKRTARGLADPLFFDQRDRVRKPGHDCVGVAEREIEMCERRRRPELGELPTAAAGQLDRLRGRRLRLNDAPGVRIHDRPHCLGGRGERLAPCLAGELVALVGQLCRPCEVPRQALDACQNREHVRQIALLSAVGQSLA